MEAAVVGDEYDGAQLYPGVAPGRYLVREKMFAIGDDFWVTTESGEKVYLVDGKALTLHDRLELKDASGTVLATVKKKIMSIHHSMKIEDATGETVATVRKKMFTPLHEAFEVDLAVGVELSVRGDMFNHEYGITGPNGPIAQITRKWLRVRDTYGVDIAPGWDHALIIAIAVCVDRLSAEDDD
ncbi:LURP-one-related/scramblase family protein [Embleya scabrispora]|uniref:LURP-one-related/scramblase family protein n=1 Tax=Embleya scabrispora TaxID=159449 RepID=UPI001FE17047|nr:LURP-one-related family protein [Embleya scabrispora]